MRQPDMAIQYCDESLTINGENWHAFSNRAYVHYLKRNFEAADSDLDKALALNPDARQLPQIRGMMNERRLRGRVTMEEHQ
jgi:tetratricopeptide (TPR) repeat protein